MRESKSKQIGSYKYTTVQLGGSSSRRVFTRMVKLMGGLAAGDNPIAGFLAQLNDADLDYLVQEFAAVTTVEVAPGKEPQLSQVQEEVFAGRVGDQFKWLLFCVEVNFGDFLSEMGVTVDQIVKKAQAQTKTSASTFLKDVIGPSGE